MEALRRIVLRPAVGGLVLGLLVLGSSRPAWSADVGTLIQFVAGQPAVAADVNTNFNDTKAAVNSKQNRVTSTCPAGSSIATVNADGTVVCDATAGAKVDKAGDTMTGTLTAPDFVYSAPVAGQVIALPNTCIRATSSGDMHLDMGTSTPTGNSFGPSVISIAEAPSTTLNYFCPIPLQVPAGATVTITGATLNSFDFNVTCRIQAQIRTKTFGVSSNGTVVSTVFNGVDAVDFAFLSPGTLPHTKAFPAFAPFAVPSNLIVWINATIAFNAVGGGDCRYSGVLVDYTVSKP